MRDARALQQLLYQVLCDLDLTVALFNESPECEEDVERLIGGVLSVRVDIENDPVYREYQERHERYEEAKERRLERLAARDRREAVHDPVPAGETPSAE